MGMVGNDEEEEDARNDFGHSDLFFHDQSSSKVALACDFVYDFIVLLMTIALLFRAWNNPCYSSELIQLMIFSLILVLLSLVLCIVQWIGYNFSRPFHSGFRMMRVFLSVTIFILVFTEVYIIAEPHVLWGQ